MQIEEISLKHQSLLEPLLYNLGSNIGLFSFANLFLYRNIYKPTLIKNSKFFIKGLSRDNKSFIFPLEPWSLVESEDISFMLSQAQMIFQVDTQSLTYFPKHQFKCEYLDENSDYLYLTKNFIGYEGLC